MVLSLISDGRGSTATGGSEEEATCQKVKFFAKHFFFLVLFLFFIKDAIFKDDEPVVPGRRQLVLRHTRDAPHARQHDQDSDARATPGNLLHSHEIRPPRTRYVAARPTRTDA